MKNNSVFQNGELEMWCLFENLSSIELKRRQLGLHVCSCGHQPLKTPPDTQRIKGKEAYDVLELGQQFLPRSVP